MAGCEEAGAVTVSSTASASSSSTGAPRTLAGTNATTSSGNAASTTLEGASEAGEAPPQLVSQVYIWGAGNALPRLVEGLIEQEVERVAAGGLQSGPFFMAQTGAGTLLGWGAGGHGQLGTGARRDSKVPVAVKLPAGSVVREVACGTDHTVVCTLEGLVYAFGRNDQGQLGSGTLEDSAEPVLVSGVTGAVSVCAGPGVSGCVTGSGTLFTWGRAFEGQLGFSADPPQKQVTAVAVGGLPAVRAAAMGGEHTLVLTAAGDVYAFGSGEHGRLGFTGDSLLPRPVLRGKAVVAVACGATHSLAATSAGLCYAWGDNQFGQCGVDSKAHGTVAMATVISKLTGSGVPRALAAGDGFSCVCTEAGKVMTFGCNQFNRLGHSGTRNTAVPTTVEGLRDKEVRGGVASAVGGIVSVCIV